MRGAAGFEDGTACLLTDEQIERQRPFVTTDLFRMLPGYQLNYPRSGSPDSVSIISNHSVGFKSTGCAMNIFINGTPAEATAVNKVPPGSIDGIEVHDVATAPVK